MEQLQNAANAPRVIHRRKSSETGQLRWMGGAGTSHLRDESFELVETPTYDAGGRTTPTPTRERIATPVRDVPRVPTPVRDRSRSRGPTPIRESRDFTTNRDSIMTTRGDSAVPPYVTTAGTTTHTAPDRDRDYGTTHTNLAFPLPRTLEYSQSRATSPDAVNKLHKKFANLSPQQIVDLINRFQ